MALLKGRLFAGALFSGIILHGIARVPIHDTSIPAYVYVKSKITAIHVVALVSDWYVEPIVPTLHVLPVQVHIEIQSNKKLVGVYDTKPKTYAPEQVVDVYLQSTIQAIHVQLQEVEVLVTSWPITVIDITTTKLDILKILGVQGHFIHITLQGQPIYAIKQDSPVNTYI